nr:alpha-L-rhamnosidase [Granulicella sp. dw_53]
MERGVASLAALSGLPALGQVVEVSGAAPEFRTSNARWQGAYDKALSVLAHNVRVMPRYDKPILIEGADYAGIWQECGPHESLVYRHFRKDVARNSHMTFFALQRPDGQIPANNKLTETGFGQIQMVVPIAATAWELARATGDDELLRTAYASCSRWDDWLGKYRNTRGTGLVEGFCTYDTGHDNSPRWEGIPPQCPGKDAKRYPPLPSLPRLCPDLSATVYGARVALSAMAQALGKSAEAQRWMDSAERIRGLILSKLYVSEDATFYDLDAENNFVKVRSDILSRMCGEHVVDQRLFDELWTRQIHNPKAFWAPFPLPSVALDDPRFVRPIPRNSWGGASQALTALRAIRWFDHYGRSAEFSFMMDRWCDALQRDMTFRQQLDPLSGDFTKEDMPSYSPASLVMMEYTWRLAGVCEEVEELQWNIRPGHPAAEAAHFRIATDAGRVAEVQYESRGAVLKLNSQIVGSVQSGTARLVTDKAGKPVALLGIHEQPQKVSLKLPGHAVQSFSLLPNQRIRL